VFPIPDALACCRLTVVKPQPPLEEILNRQCDDQFDEIVVFGTDSDNTVAVPLCYRIDGADRPAICIVIRLLGMDPIVVHTY